MINLDGEYEFEVGVVEGNDYQAHHRNYVVQLPHSCDEWVIVENSSKDVAILRMEAFIAEANQALEILKQQP